MIGADLQRARNLLQPHDRRRSLLGGSFTAGLVDPTVVHKLAGMHPERLGHLRQRVDADVCLTVHHPVEGASRDSREVGESREGELPLRRQLADVRRDHRPEALRLHRPTLAGTGSEIFS